MTFCANYPRLTKSLTAVKLYCNLFIDCFSSQSTTFTQRKYQNNRTPKTRARSTQLLKNFTSTAVAWVYIGSALDFGTLTAIKHLDCAPSSPLPAAPDPNRPDPKPPNHAEVRSCGSLAYSEYLTSCVRATQGVISNNSLAAATRLEYQPELTGARHDL